jgi:hypothetical protein
MKPSDIVLSMPPLTACFKKSESECAAALLIWYLQTHGDEWQPVFPKQLGEAMKEATDNDLLKSWATNPFFSPDMWQLSKDGFITPIDGSFNQPLAFTELGLEALKKSPWNKKNVHE